MLDKFHEAFVNVTLHSDQTEILEETVEKLEESFDGASPENGSETTVIMADDRYPVTESVFSSVLLLVSVRTQLR